MTWYSLVFLMVGTTTVSAGKGYLWELACGVIVTLPITYIAEEEKEKQSADLDISLPKSGTGTHKCSLVQPFLPSRSAGVQAYTSESKIVFVG